MTTVLDPGKKETIDLEEENKRLKAMLMTATSTIFILEETLDNLKEFIRKGL